MNDCEKIGRNKERERRVGNKDKQVSKKETERKLRNECK